MAKKVDQRPGLRPGSEHYAPKQEGGAASAVPPFLANARDSVEKSWAALSDLAQHLTVRDLTRAGRAFALGVSQFKSDPGDAAALSAGLAAALTQLTTQPNYSALASVYRAQLSALMQDDAGRASTDVGVVLEKYAACLAIGIANATLEYHIADTAGEKRHWQQQATEFADTIYRLSPPHEIAVHTLLASYAAVDLDIATLRQRVRENEGRLATSNVQPAQLPGEPYAAPPALTPADLVATRKVRTETAKLEALIAGTESHLLSQIDVSRMTDDFTRHHHRGIALQLMGDPERATVEYEAARTVFRGRRDRNVEPAASELQNEVVMLNRMSGLTTADMAREYLGEASGLIDWLGITKPELAKVMRIENKELMVPLSIQGYEALFAKGEISPEQFNTSVVREYQDIARHCAALTTSDPQIHAAIHDHLLMNKMAALERELGFVGVDPAETDERQTAAIHDFERAQFDCQLTASDEGWHEASGRAAWALATHHFHHGKIEAALGYLREIREHHPDSTAAAILRTPQKDLWVREFGILTADGDFSSQLGNPDFVAGLKTAGGKIFDDKAGAMKGVMAGAGIGLGMATADFFAGSHVFGGGVLAVTTGQLLFGGAVAGLTVERAHRLASSWEDISASYTLGVTHVRGEDLKNNAASFGIEIGSMFVGGFAGQAVKQGLTRLGSRWLTQWLATRGMIYSDITLAREFVLVREAAYVGEGMIFHPVAGAARVAMSSAIDLPAYPIGLAPKDFFSSWLSLRTLGLVGAWNPGAILAASGRLADRATRAFISNAIAQTILTPAHAALSGDFSNLGLHYFDGLYDLLAITAGQHATKSVGHAKKLVEAFHAVGAGMVERAQDIMQTLRREAARYEQVPGPLVLIAPLRRESRAGTTVLRLDLPGLPALPLKQSSDDRARMISDWADTHFAAADVDSQQTQLAEIGASCATWLDKAVLSADAALTKFASHKISATRLLDQLTSIRHDWDVYTTIFTSILGHIPDEASREATVQNYEETRHRYQELHVILEQIESDVGKSGVTTLPDHQGRLREAFGIADRAALGELQFATSLYARAVAIGDPQLIQDAELVLHEARFGGEDASTYLSLRALARRIRPLWSQYKSDAQALKSHKLTADDMKSFQTLAEAGIVTEAEYGNIMQYLFTIEGAPAAFKNYLNRNTQKAPAAARRSVLLGLLYGLSRIASVSRLLKQEASALTRAKITIPDYVEFSQKASLNDIQLGVVQPLRVTRSAEVQNEVPMIAGHLWDLKSCVRYSYGTTVNAHNKVLKYQEAVEWGRAAAAAGTFDPARHIQNATIEVTGNVEPAFVTFMAHHAPDVELLYALPLPDGHELVFPLKDARAGQSTLRRIFPPTPLTPREVRIARGIQRQLELGTLVEIFNNTILTQEDVTDSPSRDALIASERDGFINPIFIDDVEALKEYERLSYTKRIQLLEEAAAQPMRHPSPVSQLWESHVFPSPGDVMPAEVATEIELAPEVEPSMPPSDMTPKLALPGLPVLVLPLSADAETSAKAIHDQKVAIAAWLNVHVEDEPLSAQVKAVAALARAHQTWLHSAEAQLRVLLSELEAGRMTLDVAATACNRIVAEGASLFLVHGGLHGSMGPDVRSFALMMRSSLSQAHTTISGVADMIPFSYDPNDPSSLRFLYGFLDKLHSVRGDSYGLSIPLPLYESARNILWWLDNHGQRSEGELVWSTTGALPDHKPHLTLFDGYVWPPSPERDPVLATQLALLGWELHYEEKEQRVVLKAPPAQILQPEPTPSFSRAAVDALPPVLREALLRHRFENISDEGGLTQAILKDPVGAGDGILGQLANGMIWGAVLEFPQNDRLADILSNGSRTLHVYLSALSVLPPEIRPHGITATQDPTVDFLQALDLNPHTHPTLRKVLKYVDHEHHSHFLQKLDRVH